MYKSTLLLNAILLSPIIETKGIWIYLPCICLKLVAVLIDYWKWNFTDTTDLSSKVIFPKGTIWRAECAVFLLPHHQHVLLMHLRILSINLWITMALYGKVDRLMAENIFHIFIFHLYCLSLYLHFDLISYFSFIMSFYFTFLEGLVLKSFKFL